MTSIVARANSHGVDWELNLDRVGLLPGTTASGSVALVAPRGTDGRGLVAALIATEQWQFQQTTTDGQGRTSSRTVTETKELQRLPVQLADQLSLAAGERREFAVEVPVPPLGPATLDATVSRLTWDLEIKLDRPGGLDSAIVVPVTVLQPTGLLRAGVVRVEEFALYEAADSATDEARASVEIKPMPICVGAPLDGRLTIETTGQLDLQEIRLEIRVKVQATVSGGLDEELTLWTGRLVGPGPFGGASQVLQFRGDIPATLLPTIELPHGRTDATFHVILARAWARDPHLVRDIAVCSTTEI
ncbi:MAG: hypothetical protein ACXWWR_06855 [Candidatus Limnocylindrales bacterium]